MGAHIMVRKKGMSRDDIALLLDKASFVDVVCFLKETRYDDFTRKHGEASLHSFSVPLENVPDEWIDYDGDIVLNNMGFSGADDVERVLGFCPPGIDSDAHDLKRGRGKASRVIRVMPPNPNPGPVVWMTPNELRQKMTAAKPKSGDSAATWVIPTFQAIAAGGFDCCILY